MPGGSGMRPSRTRRLAVFFCTLAVGCGTRALAGPQGPGSGQQGSAGGIRPTVQVPSVAAAGPWQPLVAAAAEAERAGHFVKAGRLAERAARLADRAGAERGLLVSLWRRAAWAYERAGWLYDALRCLDRVAGLVEGRALRVALVHRMARLLSRLRFERRQALWRALRQPGRSLLAGLLGPLLARAWAGRGRRDLADRILGQVRGIAHQAGALLREGRVALPGRLGFLAVLSGRYARWSRSALRGAFLAVQEASAGRLEPFELRVVPLAQGVRPAVETLRYTERVAVAIGPVGKLAREAAAEAARVGLPLVVLSASGAERRRGVFSYLPRAESRFLALLEAARPQVRCVLAPRCRGKARRRRRRCRRLRLLNRPDRTALVVPDTPVGRRLAEAARSLSGWPPGQPQVFTYRLGQTTFTDLARSLKRGRFGLVAAAMGWATLSMFAAQLAAAGLWSSVGRRRILLAALGDGVTPSRLARSARYLEGALLAPAFVPDPQDGRWGAFVGAFQAKYGVLPDTLAAYGYEAAFLAIRALRRGRDGLAERLGATTIRGQPVFDGQGRYARQAEIYRVVRGRLVSWSGPSCGGRP